MDWSVVLKLVHVVAAIVAVGSNVTYAFWLRYAQAEPERLSWTLRGIRMLDNRVANPAYAVLLITGVAMVLLGRARFEQGWIAISLAIYVLVVLIGIFVYAPTLRRQVEEAERDPKSSAYQAVAGRSTALGILTVVLVLVIVSLMVLKPF